MDYPAWYSQQNAQELGFIHQKGVDVAGCDAGGGRGGAGGQAELPLHPPRQENWAPGQPGRWVGSNILEIVGTYLISL